MKSFQDRLFKDFDVEKTVGKNGKVKNTYVYVGDYAVWSLTGEELTRYKRLYAGAGIALLLLYIWKSFMRVPLNSSRIVGASTLLQMAALMPVAAGIWGFVFAGRQMYLRDTRQIRSRILWGCMLYLILQVPGIIGGIVYMASNGTSFLSVLVILAGFLSAFLAFALYAVQLRLGYRDIPNNRKMDEDNKVILVDFDNEKGSGL